MRQLGWTERLDALRQRKAELTQWKLATYGRTMDADDKGIERPPEGYRFDPAPFLSEGGGICGARACGAAFRAFLENHPVCIDPMGTLAGGWADRFDRYRQPAWSRDLPYADLQQSLERYDIVSGIGACQHFTPDIRIGFRIGWGGIRENIRRSRLFWAAEAAKERGAAPDWNMQAPYELLGTQRPAAKCEVGAAWPPVPAEERVSFLDGLEDVVCGIQNLIRRHADAADGMADAEMRPEIRESLRTMARINRRLVCEPPASFQEACQFTAWQIVTFDMYNGAGAALGSIDSFLKPFYDADRHAGVLDDETAIFHLCCLFLKDNTYYQIGGSDKFGNDRTNEVSFLLLEAMHRLKIPVSLCVRVHERLNPALLSRAVDILCEDRMGQPNFLGDPATNEGFMRLGFPLELAVDREKSGCHWSAIPGREYTLNDCVKINFAKVFEVAFRAMMDGGEPPCVDRLWQLFAAHLADAVDVTAQGLDFHMRHMHRVFPELPMDLLCYGPVERGLDATHGGVEFVNLCVDGAGLALVADSFAAAEQRVERERVLSWEALDRLLATDYQDAEAQRRMLCRVPRYGSGGSRADEYAVRITRLFCDRVRAKTTPDGFRMVPGLFSWANTIPMGRVVGATPNGRHAGEPITHGANPEPGFREAGAMTAMAVAVASVQCGYGNAVPIQLEVDPLEGASEAGRKAICDFLSTYCLELGGTLVNLNLLDRAMLMEAHRDPDRYPNLIVKVTGFSAYFATLSEKFRQLVVDRLLTGL